MRRITILSAMLIIAVSLVFQVIAGDDPVAATDSGPAATDTEPGTVLPTSPLARTILEIRDGAQTKLADLQRQLAAAATGSTANEEVHLRIAQVKQETEIAILRAVIADSRERGDEVQAAEAEDALDRLVNPDQYRSASIPVERPTPSR